MVADVYVVAAFGQILPQRVLDIPRMARSTSMLPCYHAGAARSDSGRHSRRRFETGVTIMLMDAGMDTGPILAQRAIPIADDETGQSLHDKLAILGSDS